MDQLGLFRQLQADMDKNNALRDMLRRVGKVIGSGTNGVTYYALDGKAYVVLSYTQTQCLGDYFEFMADARNDKVPGFHPAEGVESWHATGTLIFFSPVLDSYPDELPFREVCQVTHCNREVVVRVDGGGDWCVATIEVDRSTLVYRIHPETRKAFYPNRTMTGKGWAYYAFKFIPGVK